ncbi:excalibur calcium-binding domain-containing protein [Novosphingobium sp.]|uniref:excalibur calcium-binding domain-containing protein n=1 Tax=Novosphingobium sp. TaxID=1874826 RepID=UPI0026252DE3|nr:excalibur calcium-binding domain-containing protein [Novosphingobium sp.]
MRKRAPQTGDHWISCDQARAAGTVPLYIGEPGYRVSLDADADGVACEPYRWSALWMHTRPIKP